MTQVCNVGGILSTLAKVDVDFIVLAMWCWRSNLNDVGMASDPWSTMWVSDANGSATISLDLLSFTLDGEMPVSGRAVVVHDSAAKGGARSGCGIIVPAKPAVTHVGKYPEYSGDMTVEGTVLVSESMSTVTIRGTLIGLEPNVTGGLHIHGGYSCEEAAGVFGHYFEPGQDDPWTTTYTSDSKRNNGRHSKHSK